MPVGETLNHPAALTVFLLTLLAPVIVGFLAIKRTRNEEDFFIGGRSMSKFMVALSAVSSGRSSWLILGVSGIAFLRGVAAIWAVTGYILVELLQFVVIGKKLRQESGRQQSITLLDYFCSKFRSEFALRLTGAIILIVFLTAYVGAQFNAGAKSLSAALQISFPLALVITLLLILIYMIAGGYIAVVYNDVMRAFIMILALLFLPVYSIFKTGGINTLLRTLQALDPTLIDPFSLTAGMLIGYLGIGLGSPGQPHIVVRYMSIKCAGELKKAALIGTVWNVFMAWGAIFIGLAGRAIFNNLESLPQRDPEMTYIALSSFHLSPLIFGFLIGGIFAAILSTADSQLLVLASTFVRDIYEKLILEKLIKSEALLSEQKKVAVSRLVVLICGIFSALLAYFAQETIFWLVLFAWGGLGAAFGTTLLFSLYWKKTSAAGIIAAFIGSTLTLIGWKLFLIKLLPVYELIPAFLAACLLLIIFSLLFPQKKYWP